MSRRRNKGWWKAERKRFLNSKRPITFVPEPESGAIVVRPTTDFYSGTTSFPWSGAAYQHRTYENIDRSFNHARRFKRKGKGLWVNKTVGSVPIRWRMPSPYRSAEVQTATKPTKYHSFKWDYRGPWTRETMLSFFCSFPSPEQQHHRIMRANRRPTPDPATLIPMWNTPGFGASTNLLNATNIAVLKKVGNTKTSWGIAAAELHKSVDTIAKNVLALFKAFRHARKGDFNSAIGALSTTGSSWKGKDKVSWLAKNAGSRHLEFRYGITPIMIDIEDALKLIKGGMNVVQMGRAKDQRITKVTETVTAGNKLSGYTITRTYNVGYVVTIHYGVDGHNLRNLNKLGLLDPFAVGWDLLPWTFLIDQVIGVADFLSAFSATSGVTFVSGTQTYFCDAEATFKGHDTEELPACIPGFRRPLRQVIEQSTTAQSRCMDRKVLTSFPIPRIVYKNPLSMRNLATVLALVNSRSFQDMRTERHRR